MRPTHRRPSSHGELSSSPCTITLLPHASAVSSSVKQEEHEQEPPDHATYDDATTTAWSTQSQQDHDEVEDSLHEIGTNDGDSDQGRGPKHMVTWAAVTYVAAADGVSAVEGQEGSSLQVDSSVPVSAIACVLFLSRCDCPSDNVGSLSLMRVLLDYKSTAPHPWYSLAKLPAQGCAWEIRTPTQSILTIGGVAVRLFSVGPVTAMCFYTAIADAAARSRITIKLMRPEDRAALGGMHNRARWEAPATPVQPAERFTAIAVHNHEEVRTLPRSRAILTATQVFSNIFDATVSFRAREQMSTIHPFKLRVRDIVLIESIVVRTQTAHGWKVTYHADGIFRLVRRPQAKGQPSVVSNPLHVAPVHFPLWL